MLMRTKVMALGWIALFAVVALVSTSVVVFSRFYELNDRLHSVSTALSDLRSADELASEVLLVPSERVHTQWNNHFPTLTEDIDTLFADLDVSDGMQQEVLGRLNSINRTIQRLQLEAFLSNAAARKILVARLNANRNGLFSVIEELQIDLESRRSDLILTLTGLVAVTMLLASLLIFVFSFLVRRALLQSVEEISTAVERLNPKSPTGAIVTDRNDEIGQTLHRLERARLAMVSAFEQEAAARKNAEQLNASKTAFVATMSHELRTSLNGLMGSIAFLTQADLPAEQKKYVTMAESSGQALLSITNDVLDFSRIESGKIEIEIIPYFPSIIVEDMSSIYTALMEEKGLSFNIVSDIKSDLAVLGDPSRTRQILFNLISNALKFTESGGIRLKVELLETGDERQPRLVFAVQDTGIGIPREKLKAIFDAFSQVDDSTSRKFGGSGLGLAICSKLASAMGGDLTVESTAGIGSTFTFTVPVKLTDAALVHRQNQPEDTEHSQIDISNLKVLVVDDVELNRSIASDMLRHWGCRVGDACDGREAVDAVGASIENDPYHVVLMDVQMPVMDGEEATKEIRSQGWDVPIVGVTANAFVEQQNAYLKAGMNCIVSKPVNWIVLRETLASLVVSEALTPVPEVLGTDGQLPPPESDSNQNSGPTSDEGLAADIDADSAVKSGADTEAYGNLAQTFDMEILDSLKSAIPGSAIEVLLEKAMVMAENSVAEMSPEMDHESRRKVAHSLKGASSNVGLKAIADKAAALQFETDPEAVATILEQFGHTLEVTRKDLEKLDL